MAQEHIQKILDSLPTTPGIYKFKNAEQTILYVGKAKNLRNRVKSYFLASTNLDTKKQKMVEQITDIDYTEVGNEWEALVLETNMIKQFKPKYNVAMRDDKNYVYIRITTDEDFPRISTVRKVEKDKALYFGPKTADHKVKKLLELLRKILPFRHCDLDIKFLNAAATKGHDHEVEVTHKVIKYPCLYYYIRKCAAPCIGKVTPEEYKKIIDKVVHFLNGRPDELIAQIKEEMMTAAKDQKFEKAAGIRDKLMAIEDMFEKQRINDPDRKDTDVFHYVAEDKKVYANLFQIREGRIIGQENFILDVNEMGEEVTSSEIINAFLRDYYEKATNVPKEIFIPDQMENQELIEEWLSEKKGNKVKIFFPLIGEKNGLLELSLKNAASFAHQHKAKWMRENVEDKESLENLSQLLKLPKLARHIECYDISHIGGTDTVASMIVFKNGFAESGGYRRFKLRTIEHGKPDDYASMKEVLTRRLKYIAKSDIRLQKAGKKHEKNMKKWAEECGWPDLMEKPDTENFYIILKEKTAIGMIRLKELSKSIFEISGLYIGEKHRGEKLSFEILDKLIKNIKDKKARIYISVEEKLINHYLEFGFIQTQEVPEIFQESHEKFGKIDNKKYKILAYYLAKRKKIDESFLSKPDLIILDGGKGQLGIGVEVLKTLNLDIPICSLAKREEEIFTPDKKNPILLPHDSPTLHLFQRIRDEAHRFAITYSGKTHNKSMITSQLDEIPGIGDISKQKLLNAFGNLENVKMAPLDQLSRVIGKKAAIKLKQELQR